MNGFYLDEAGQGHYRLISPDGTGVMLLRLPPDGMYRLDFDVLNEATRHLSQGYGFSEVNTNKLKNVSVPKSVDIVEGDNFYDVYINGSLPGQRLQVARIMMPKGILGYMIVEAISAVIFRRWSDSAKNTAKKKA